MLTMTRMTTTRALVHRCADRARPGPRRVPRRRRWPSTADEASGDLEATTPQVADGHRQPRRIGTACRAGRSARTTSGEPGRTTAVVIGSMHGNEKAGLQVVDALRKGRPVVGRRPLGDPDDQPRRCRPRHPAERPRCRPQPQLPAPLGCAHRAPTTPAPGPLSEPESRALRRFLHRVRPDVRRLVPPAAPRRRTRRRAPAVPAPARTGARACAIKPFNCSGVCHGTMTSWYNAQPRRHRDHGRVRIRRPSRKYLRGKAARGTLGAVLGSRRERRATRAAADLGFARRRPRARAADRRPGGRLRRRQDPGPGRRDPGAVCTRRTPTRAVLATRLTDEARAAVAAALPEAVVDDVARCATLGAAPAPVGTVAVVSAGTSDAPVAAEAALTARVHGAGVRLIQDVGVAGPAPAARRCAPSSPSADCLVVVAGHGGRAAERRRRPGRGAAGGGADVGRLRRLVRRARRPARDAQLLRAGRDGGEHRQRLRRRGVRGPRRPADRARPAALPSGTS